MSTPNVTESDSLHRDLEKKSISELLYLMNQEDKKVPLAVESVLPEIETLVSVIVEKMRQGGRLFYIGAGTSGRLGILDASECPPTFGVPHDMVIGIIAGGDSAIRKAVEFAEDSTTQAWIDLKAHDICPKDVVIGIAASGRTPYVVAGLKACRSHGIITGSISCNLDSPVVHNADHPIAVDVGPEFLTGSTRLKSGTAQKLILNMITTTTMIQLGRVQDNKMVDMQLSNNKLVERGIKMLMDFGNISRPDAMALIKTHGSVRGALNSLQ
ncbi:MAG TPA: N-acetylmuramic acid 6-phosphate etherase [Flavobacteriaceae bacterium]|nr:N-acetylmuramic acid 6-phosphate etherase [Flavobacteriaceae bacterium]